MTTNSGSLTANVVDVARRRIRLAEVSWTQTAVDAVTEIGEPDPAAGYLIPGFVDAHVHVESSLLTPSEFARAAVAHGTVAAVSDPHEIGNVLGVEGVRWMLADAARTSASCPIRASSSFMYAIRANSAFSWDRTSHSAQ